MHEQSKAAKRRFNDGAFTTRYFVGRGLDIGAGPDGLSRMARVFPLMGEVRDWDLADGDAQYLASVPDSSFDFVHSSHCLEHMADPRVALAHWIRAVRPGGHIVVTVPDEDMYERGEWPSRRNPDHKWTFTACKPASWSPRSVNLLDLAKEVSHLAALERLTTVRDFFRPEAAGDQTLDPVTECAIEMVLRRLPADPAPAGLHGALDRNLMPPIGRNRLKACSRGVMLFNANDTGVGRVLDRYGEYSEAELEVFERLLRPGDTAVDAGANIGAIAVALAAMVGPAGAVHAFEAQPHVFRTLVANAALNEHDHLHCHNAALGGEEGVIEVPAMDPGKGHSFGSVEIDPARRGVEAGAARGHLVPLRTIDALALARCRLIKADVEGMEPAVLRGARETVARCRPVLYLEADREDAIPLLLGEIAEVGYRAYWHVAPYVRDANFHRRPVEFFRGVVAPNILAVPPGFEVNGLVPVATPSWRSDLGSVQG